MKELWIVIELWILERQLEIEHIYNFPQQR